MQQVKTSFKPNIFRNVYSVKWPMATGHLQVFQKFK